jgi:DNA-binding LytR/AlgR family response regulator
VIRTLLVDDEAPARARLRRLLADHPDVSCVGEAASGAEAVAAARVLAPDLVLLDVEMPEMNGLEVARALAADRDAAAPAIVFVTAFEQHALSAFDVAAVDYLVKPIAKGRLRDAIDRVRARVASRNAGAPADARRLGVRAGARYVVFDAARVSAAVADDHYVTIYADGKELVAEEPLDELAPRLGEERFVRIHRKAIVNVDFVRELVRDGDRKYRAVLASPAGLALPVSRERLEEVKRRLGAG